MERARYAPNSGPANRRFAVPGDRPAPPCRDQMSKRTGPVRFPAALTSAAPQMPSQTNGITVRESPQPEFCNTITSRADLDKASCTSACNRHWPSRTPTTRMHWVIRISAVRSASPIGDFDKITYSHKSGRSYRSIQERAMLCRIKGNWRAREDETWRCYVIVSSNNLLDCYTEAVFSDASSRVSLTISSGMTEVC